MLPKHSRNKRDTRSIVTLPVASTVLCGKVASGLRLVYSNISKKVVDRAYSPRITIGPYAVNQGQSHWDGTKAGAIVGLEQPIHRRASLIADWYSGRNELGAFTPGIDGRRDQLTGASGDDWIVGDCDDKATGH